MRLRRLAGVFLVGLVVAGCNLPTNPSAIPFNAQTSSSGCGGPVTLTIYLSKFTANSSQLIPVRRPNAAKAANELPCALDELNAGPTADEFSKDAIQTAFGGPEGLSLVATSGNTVTVQLDASFISIASPRAIFTAFGQIVYTMTGIEVGSTPITRVRFLFDGTPYTGVALPDGSIVSRAVSRGDYCTIGPPGDNCTPKSGKSTAPTSTTRKAS